MSRVCYGMNCRLWHKMSPATIHADVRGMNCRRHELSPGDNLCWCSRHKLSPEIFAFKPVSERSVVGVDYIYLTFHIDITTGMRQIEFSNTVKRSLLFIVLLV